MASFTPPPSSQLQPFAVPAPEYQDPLESLARLRQNRLQIVQSQRAQMELESQQGALQAYKEAGGDIDAMIKIAPKYNVLPGVITALQKNQADLIQTRAQTKLYGTQEEKARLEAQDQEHDLLYQAYSPIWDEKDPDKQRATIDAINKRLVSQGWDPKKLIQPDTDVHLAKSSYTTWKNIQAKAEERARDAQIKASEANVKQSEAATKKTGKEMDKMDLAAAISAIQAAPVDEKTGTPTPAALAGIRKKFPDIPLGENPTKADIDRFIRSGVDVEKQPKFDIEANAAAQGMTGTTQWDQFLFQNARGLGKKPGELSPTEYNAIAAKYKELEVSPVMAALGETNKRLTNQVLGAQVAGLLTPAQIEANARELLSGDMAPDQIKELKPGGRVNQGGQIIQRAREIANAEGKPFRFLELEMRANQRQKTLEEFNSTLISHVGGQRLALNVVIHHANTYLETVQALKNGTFKPGNEIYNRVSTMMGKAAPTNAALISQFFAGEVAKTATGGVPGEGELNKIAVNMGNAGSPEQMEGAGMTLLEIAAGRMIPMKALRDKNRLQEFVDILDPDSREILQRRGFDPETMKPRATGGSGAHKVGDTVMYQGKPRKIISIDPKTGKLRLQLD